MIKTVEVNGQKYRVDTTPKGGWGGRAYMAKVYKIHEAPAAGALANMLTEWTSKRGLNTVLTIPSHDEIKTVVMALGRKFSQSHAWKALCFHHL